MNPWMPACMHAFMLACLNSCLHACLLACMSECMHACMLACKLACMHAWMNARLNTCLHACMKHARRHTWRHACIPAILCIHACLQSCMHACILSFWIGCGSDSVTVVACLNIDQDVPCVGRTQQVLYMGRLSSIGRLDFGVPQGSVLGLLAPFPAVHCWAVRSHQQKGPGSTPIRWCISVYQPPNHRSHLGSSRRASRRSTVGCSQTDNYRLKMNTDKTQLIWIGTLQQLSKVDINEIKLQLRHGIVLHICVGHGADSRHSAQDDRSCRGSLSVLFFSTTPDTFDQAVANIRCQKNASECVRYE